MAEGLGALGSGGSGLMRNDAHAARISGIAGVGRSPVERQQSIKRLDFGPSDDGRLRVKTDLEQQIWSECSRLLGNSVIYYNACILSELLERRERQGDQRQADQIKRVSPVSWKHVNFYGEYNFRETVEDLDLSKIVDRLEASNRDAATQAS